MVKKAFCVAVFGLLLQTALAQLSVSLHEPPAGVVQKDQLWNITLIYSGSAPVDVTIALSLTDSRTNQPVMSAITKPIALTSGVKQVQATDIGPVDYTYFSPAFDISRYPEGLLPIGDYRACYAFYPAGSSDAVLAEDCMAVEVVPLSPPQLSFPADTAIIETSFPQFSWIAPTPGVLFTSLNYDLLVTEVQPGQTPEGAIQENVPVYNAFGLVGMAYNYPATLSALDTGKLYAWRVVAKNGDLFAAQSEVWTFRVGAKMADPVLPPDATYLELKPESSVLTLGIVSGDALGVKYYSYDSTHEAAVRFFNVQGQMVKESVKTIQYGNNFMAFPLDGAFRPEETYVVEIKDLQMVAYKTSFRLTK